MRTSVLIRPAARGGKFLGPDAADARGISAWVAISDLSNGHVLAEAEIDTTGRDAGPADIMAPVSRAKPYATDAQTVGTTLAVDIDRPTVVRVTVRGPLSHPDQAREAQADVLLLPGVDIGLGDDPQGLVIEIPGYRIVRPLGRGGMASVHLAIQESVDREVALKIMSPALLADPNFGERFLREARIAAKLRHRHVVGVHDVGKVGDLHYIAMEYLTGGAILHKDGRPRDVAFALRHGKPLSLKNRLGATVGPRASGAPASDTDLP